jgi:hypothetical protein
MKSVETLFFRWTNTALGVGIVNIMDFLVPTAPPTYSATDWDLEKGERPMLGEVVIWK